jgi:hypothetical protein
MDFLKKGLQRRDWSFNIPHLIHKSCGRSPTKWKLSIGLQKVEIKSDVEGSLSEDMLDRIILQLQEELPRT